MPMDVRRVLRPCLALVLVLVLVVGMIPAASADKLTEAKEKLEALREEKSAIDDEIKALKAKMSENMDQMEDIVAQKDLIDQEIFLLHAQIENINGQVLAYSILIADKQDQLDAAQAHLEYLRALHKERIRTMEKNGAISYWSVLFKADSFSDLLDRLKMIREIAEADQARLEQVKAAAEVVEEAKDALAAEKAVLDETQKTLRAAEIELEQRRIEADALLAALLAKRQEFTALMEESEAKQDDLAEQLAKAEDEYEDAKYWLAQQNQYVSIGGGIGNTVDGVTWLIPISYNYFSSPFGYRIHPISGTWKMHNGVDLSAPTGTPIYATRSGYVSFSGYEEGGAGYYVQLTHGDGYKTIYMHMTHYIVYTGQYVAGGQVIGYCGSTGGSTGPHLHFGISYNGTYINPAKYINL